MAQCSRETCYWPEVGCDLGHPDHTRCPSWEAGGAPSQETPQPSDAVAMPWSGNVLGLADLGFVAGRGKPFVLAVVGPAKAGKTTLLAAWYLLLARGLLPTDGVHFAGSYSLGGWESIASFLRWSPGPTCPTFPPHTTSGSKRMPGLLHLTFTRDNERRRDYVVTDAPGEWFRKWGMNRDHPDAEGARWVADHADAFLLIADREALSGKEMGRARGNIQVLARRLGAERRARPVALVWTKGDIELSEDIEEAIRGSVSEQIPAASEFRVSVVTASDKTNDTGQGFLDLLSWVLKVRRSPAALPEVLSDTNDAFLSFGRRLP